MPAPKFPAAAAPRAHGHRFLAADINVFTCSGDGYLGWTWLPWTHGEGSNFQALVMNYESMPGFGALY